MAQYGELIEETTTTTGTGPVTLSGVAPTGKRTFVQEIADGNYTEYCLKDANGVDYEIGMSQFTASGPTLSREFIWKSTNGNAEINLSAGTHKVIQGPSASRFDFHGVKAIPDETQIFSDGVKASVNLITPSVNTDQIWLPGSPSALNPPLWANAVIINAKLVTDGGPGAINVAVNNSNQINPPQGSPQLSIQVASSFIIYMLNSGEMLFNPGDFFSISVQQFTGSDMILYAESWVEFKAIP